MWEETWGDRWCYFWVINKSINHNIPPSIDGSSVEEFSVGVTLAKPIYSRFSFPKVFFQQGLVISMQLNLKIPEIATIGVSNGVLNSLQSRHNFPNFMENIPKCVLVPFNSLLLEAINNFCEIRGSIKQTLRRLLKVGRPHHMVSILKGLFWILY